MHKIHSKPFSMDDFSMDHLGYFDEDLAGSLTFDNEPQSFEETAVEFVVNGDSLKYYPVDILDDLIESLEANRLKFLETKDKKFWWQLIQLLPSSYNQKRTVMLNYEVLHNIYHARKNHKLDEWHVFCDWIERLPHSEVITGKEGFDDLRGTVGERVKNSVEAYERVSEEFPSLLERNDI